MPSEFKYHVIEKSYLIFYCGPKNEQKWSFGDEQKWLWPQLFHFPIPDLADFWSACVSTSLLIGLGLTPPGKCLFGPYIIGAKLINNLLWIRPSNRITGCFLFNCNNCFALFITYNHCYEFGSEILLCGPEWEEILIMKKWRLKKSYFCLNSFKQEFHARLSSYSLTTSNILE